MTTYTPTHPDGRKGPAFDFATLACLWILAQEHPEQWDWEL